MSTIRDEAKKALEKLSDDASWDDVLYEMYVRKKIDEGIKAADKGDVISHKDVKSRFLKNGD